LFSLKISKVTKIHKNPQIWEVKSEKTDPIKVAANLQKLEKVKELIPSVIPLSFSRFFQFMPFFDQF
jgi:hypothetical protein